MKAFITGGSHTAALQKGWTDLVASRPSGIDVDLRIVPLGPALTAAGDFHRLEEDKVVITYERYRSRIAELSPDTTGCEAMGFCTPYYARTIWSNRDWSKFGLSLFEPDRVPVSAGMLRRVITEHNMAQINFLRDLKRVGFDVFAVDSPRPFSSNPETLRAGAPTVAYIDKLYREITQESLDALGIPSVMAPRSTADADGFMLERFRHEDREDTRHANGEFGALLCEEIVKHLKGSATQPQEKLTA